MRKRQLHQTFSSNPSVPSRASFPPLLSTSNRNASPKVIQPRFVKHKHNISTLLITLLLGLCVIPTLSFIPSSPISSGIKTIPIHTPSGGPSGDKASICSTRYSHISGQSKDTLAKCFSSPSSSDHQPSLSASSDSFHNNTLQSSFVSGEAKNKKGKTNEEEYPIGGVSRRSSLQGLILAAAATATASSAPLAASAGKPEVDTYGNLFSPKSDMLSGGSSAARGISTRPAGQRLKPGQALQSVYETRFIAYLSRFLLNFDPAANAWWRQSGFQDSWENYDEVDRSLAKFKFAEFAESVEFGLADYFVGPYGSYSSVQAAKAGILATDPAPSVQPKKNRGGFLDNIFSFPDGLAAKEERNNKKPIGSDPNTLEKYGVLNLYSLLKARYTSISAKRQLAMLFSFISSPNLQPTAEIRGLLAEADNATVSEVTVLRYTINNEERSRTSSRRGGGYSLDTFPEVTIESPPALGDDYRPAEVRPIMKPTSRILKIKVTDPGEGYKSSPLVVVQFTGNTRVCQATAIIDREGHISEVVVLDPGYGYGGFGGVPPKVTISKPKEKPEKGEVIRQAKAVAELEYEIVDIELISGGNGYTKTEPPKISITPPPEDPDWFLATQEQPEMRMIPVREIEPLRIEVNEMRNSDGNVVYSSLGKRQGPVVDKALVAILKRDPLELLPSNVVLEPDDLFDPPIYRIPALPPIPPNVNIPSPRFRAYDPIFGAVGAVPVTKGAVALKASEYGRLALSGAVCTVLVRTALNPLELVKTKQQLENDDELFDYARQKLMRQKKEESVAVPNTSEGNFGVPTDAPFPDQGNTAVAIKEEKAVSTSQAKSKKLGTTDLVLGILELRGPFALFQSADITFLASLVFGSFGFGATELFRRSFAQVFFSDSIDSSGGSEIALLLAASLATVVTSAAATPFEVLRVKSMILLEPASWTKVFQNFIEENSKNNGSSVTRKEEEFNFKNVKPEDVLPLWSGFAPTLSRELPFAIAKFLAFDILARALTGLLNSQTQEGALPIQVGVGPVGLTVSAVAGAIAGVCGAIVSHPADLILTYTSVSERKEASESDAEDSKSSSNAAPSWVSVIKELLSREGGVANLFLGLPARATFFFLVIGLQFFLYDYVNGLFQVGTDDLSLVLDVFYSVRSGLLDME